MVDKKSFNAFKMWGSYVGGVLLVWGGIVFTIFKCQNFNIICRHPVFDPIQAVVLSVVGFLIGWGIHSWVRALRN